MPSYLCRCNTWIDYTDIPSENSYHLVKDVDVEVEDEIVTNYASWLKATQVLCCPSCERLWIFWAGMADAPVEYLCVGVDEREG